MERFTTVDFSPVLDELAPISHLGKHRLASYIADLSEHSFSGKENLWTEGMTVLIFR